MKAATNDAGVRLRIGALPLAIAAALGSLCSVGPAVAQDQEEEQQLDEITVTGSRIIRQDFTANSPITTIDQATFENTSTIGVETVMNQLPQFVPAVTQFDTGDVQNASTNTVGASTVSLRGLGANRNLVLINGRRAMPVNGTMVVDVNMIPSAAIQRVEIISGGASAVYGADAVGGVVNFILKDDFEGAAIDVRLGDTQHGGNQEVTVSGVIGASLDNDRGNVMVGIEHSNRSKQYNWERDWRNEDYANPSNSGTAFFPTETWIGNVEGTFGNYPDQNVVNALFSQAEPCAPSFIPGFPGTCPAATLTTPGGVVNNAAFYINRTPDGTGTAFTGFSVFDGNTGAGGAYRYTGPFDSDPYGRFSGLPFRKIAPDGRIHENTFWNWLSIPLERYSTFANGEFELSDNVRLTSQALFSRTETETSLGLTSDAIGVWGAEVPYGTTIYGPSVTNLGPDGLPNTADAGENMATRAAYLSGGTYQLNCPAAGGCTESQAWPLPPDIVTLFNSRPNPEANVWMNRPLDFFREYLGDARASENVTTMMQVQFGVEGEFPSGDHFWDATVSSGRTNTLNSLGGAARLNQWRNIVGSPNFGVAYLADTNPYTTGFGEGIATCTTGLPLVRTFVPSQDCIDAMSATLQNDTEIEQSVFEANLVGDLAQMPAGPLQYALGTTYREASYAYNTDNLTRIESITDSIMGLFPQSNSAGKFDVSELYGELLVPIVSDGPAGVEHFTVELGGRVSDFSSVGKVDTYKGLIDWGITPQYRLRGGFNRAHRAPNLAELFTTRTQIFNFGSAIYGDQCSQNNQIGPFSANPALNADGAAGAANAYAICRALMGTVGAAEYYDNRPLNQQPTGIPVFGTTSSVGIENTTGNVNLTEEQADTFTLGVVMDFLENWTLTVDYWTVEVTDMIAVEPPDDVYERCLSLASNPGADPTTEGCLSIVRNPSTGAGAQIDLSYSNQGRAEFSGVDLSLNWSKPLAVGGLGLTVFGSYNLESKTQSAAESPTIEWAGTQGCALQMDCQQYDYRIFTTLNYFRGAWGVTLRHQFWPEILSSQCSSIAIPAACAISTGGVRENYQLFALSGSYQFRDKYTLRMGIENLLDEEPPLTGGNPNGVPYARPPTHVGGFGPGIGTYDPLGRRGFVSMTMNF